MKPNCLRGAQPGGEFFQPSCGRRFRQSQCHQVGQRRGALGDEIGDVDRQRLPGDRRGSSSGKKCTPAMTASVVTTNSRPARAQAARSRPSSRTHRKSRRRAVPRTLGSALPRRRRRLSDGPNAAGTLIACPSRSNSAARSCCASLSSTPLTTFGSSSEKNECATLMYSLMTTRAARRGAPSARTRRRAGWRARWRRCARGASPRRAAGRRADRYRAGGARRRAAARRRKQDRRRRGFIARGARKAQAHELVDDIVEVGAGEVHLVEALHGGNASCGTRGQRDLARRWCRFAGGGHALLSLECALKLDQPQAGARRIATFSARVPPRARASACSSLSTVRMPLPTGTACLMATSISQ